MHSACQTVLDGATCPTDNSVSHPHASQSNGQLVTRPEFHHLIKRLRDRINALAYFYSGETLEIDYHAFGTRAEAIRTVRSTIHWVSQSRRSWKSKRHHEMGGFVGEVTYEGDFTEFLPLLILGQYTHVGKYAVWGNGHYEIVESKEHGASG